MADTKHAVTITDANFEAEVINSDVPVLVDFWAEWCGPCVALAPAIEELAQEYEGKFKVAKLDVDANSQTSMQFGVRSIPTLIFFKGGQQVDKTIGKAAKADLKQRMERILA
jgi:thioredoxin 1